MMGMFEILKPPHECWIYVFDNTLEAVASGPLSPLPYFIFEDLQAFSTHKAFARFESVSQKLKTISLLKTVTNVSLLRMQSQLSSAFFNCTNPGGLKMRD